jgi:SAM-dependent methyltransferase
MIRMFRRLRQALAPRSSSQTYGEWWGQAALTLRQARITTIDDLSEEQYQMRGLRGDANSPGALKILEWTQTAADRKARVLELGCGIARLGREMAPFVAEWHGLDISATMVDHARARTAHLPNVQIHHLTTTAPELLPYQPWAAEPFDMVYSTVVLMHLDKEDLFAYLRSLLCLLKPGGRAYFDTWNIIHPDTFRIWKESSVTGDSKPRGRMQCSSPDEFCLYLHKAGFVVERLDRHERLIRAVVRRPTDSAAVHSPYPTDTPLDLTSGRTRAGDSFAPFGYVTFPGPGDRVKESSFAISGWVLDRVERVSITAKALASDGRETGVIRTLEATLGGSRPEIPDHFPGYSQADLSGWDATMNLEGFAPGEVRLEVVATDSEGASTDLAGVDLTVLYQPGSVSEGS